jgi:hypothetical protein
VGGRLTCGCDGVSAYCREWEELSGDEAEAVIQEEAAFKRAVDNFEWNACQCLFDSHVEPTVAENITYMGNKYGFFVPVRMPCHAGPSAVHLRLHTATARCSFLVLSFQLGERGMRGAQDVEFLSDCNGMLRYLAMKINLGSQCLYCEKELRNAEAARKHMIDKGHCKLRYGQPGDEDAEEDLEVTSISYTPVAFCSLPHPQIEGRHPQLRGS